jgi:ATP-binding cassette subfamily B protein
MDAGRLLSVGTHRQLVATEPLYARLSELQFREGEAGEGDREHARGSTA